ncbi:MAG: hypothetical protein HN999_00420 [Candidatus Marinimicrobia bacterium]|jgi:hypothetical protein|nr:hypothetical protein [Candidatus Neomarinimicrobiota bacterium]MBT6941652.1 hypothetical protein [Candidatus Neomarinimicrobiota bacterium]MBT7972860.1 hypothetical protein [Candidatus Neomarinimicrobiota bacterium]
MAQRIKHLETYLWQETKRIPVYRIQTNDHKVARKLKKREKAKLVMYGVNAPIWSFQIKYSSPRLALLGLGNITGEDVRETADTGVFVSYTLPYMDITNEEGVQL